MILLVSQMMVWPKFWSFVTFIFGFLVKLPDLFHIPLCAGVCFGDLLTSENELLWMWAKERHGRRIWGEGEDDDDDGVCGLPKAKEITTFKSFSLWTNQAFKIVYQVYFPAWSHSCILFSGGCIIFPCCEFFCLISFCILLCSHHAEMADSKAGAELLDIILTRVHHFFFQQFYWLIFFQSFICDFLLVLLVAKPKRLGSK